MMKNNSKMRINLYLDRNLMEVIEKQAKENYLPKAAFLRQLIFVAVAENTNNISNNPQKHGK